MIILLILGDLLKRNQLRLNSVWTGDGVGMANERGKSIYERMFSNRTGRIGFFLGLPFAFIMLFIPTASIIGTFLFAGLIASRLNDIGRSRWHAAWLTVWMLLVVTMAEAHPAHGITMAQHRAGLGLIELPLFILLLVLGLFPGQKQGNSFGPAPLGLRGFWKARRDARAYRKLSRKLLPQMKSIMAQNKVLSTKVQELNTRLQERRAAGDSEAVKALQAEFAKAVEASQAGHARFQAVNAQLEPARNQFLNRVQRIAETEGVNLPQISDPTAIAARLSA